MHESKLHRIQVSSDQSPPMAQGENFIMEWMHFILIFPDMQNLFSFTSTKSHPPIMATEMSKKKTGEKGRRIRELTSVVQKRFKFPKNSVVLAQVESLRNKLLGGLAVCRFRASSESEHPKKKMFAFF
ncbi:hypothetical protein IFM89_027090 [Coptis chinensis]|uniref:Uncharacterized protein n=1 Tax=Coptis chinensis TaxID=261450 RepID=A0A835I6Q0_9MAGN|nr:hypothetical protein IFM89_027090 [Coptis chinensis]